MKIEIKHQSNGSVLFAHEQEKNTMKITLEAGITARADLSGASLRGADLYGADLRGAILRDADIYGADLRDTNLYGASLRGANLRDTDLRDADLYGAILRDADLRGATYGEGIEIGDNPLFILGLAWPVYIFKTHIKIGCQIHSKRAWLEFTDSDIAKMAPNAAEFWNKWKKHILWMAMEGIEE